MITEKAIQGKTMINLTMHKKKKRRKKKRKNQKVKKND